MRKHTKPGWGMLLVLGLLGGATLYAAARLPISVGMQTLALLLWIALFYMGLVGWLRRNSEALEQEPPALDAVGRPIIDNGAPVFITKASREATPAAPQSLNRSEAF